MKNRQTDFQDLEILKEKYKFRILEQELRIKSTVKELGESLTGASMVKKLQDNMFGGTGIAFKLGFLAVALIRDRFRERRKK